MEKNRKTKALLPKHLSVPIDLAFSQPYHSIKIQETSIMYPDEHHIEKIKRVYVSDNPTIENNLFDELFQQSEYSTHTHSSEKKTKNKTQKQKPKSKTKSQKKQSNSKV